MDNEISKVMAWLRAPPFAPERINAKNPSMYHRILLHEAEFGCNLSLISILLQYGAEVDPLSASGMTPLGQACTRVRLEPANGVSITQCN